MQRRRCAGLSVLGLVAGLACAHGSASPFARFCEAEPGADATAVIEMYYLVSSASSRPMVRQSFTPACLEQSLGRVAELLAAYCAARAEAGHDALALELHAFRRSFESIARECERETMGRFHRRALESIPCRDVESFLRDALPTLAVATPRDRMPCVEAAIPEVAASLEAECSGSGLPGAEHVSRHLERLLAACAVPR